MGKRGSRQPKLYLYWEAPQKKNKQPNCGSRLFCSPKASQLSKVSQQFCRRLLILQNKWYQKKCSGQVLMMEVLVIKFNYTS